MDKIEQLENNQHQGTFEGDQQQAKQKQKDSYDDFDVVDFDDFNRY